MRERRQHMLRTLVALTMVSACVLGTNRPVGATMTGVGSFPLLTVTMDVFPCPSGGCSGLATGSAGLSLSGLGTATIINNPVPVSVAYTAAWLPAVSALTVTFTYQDDCLESGVIAPTANADGGFTLSGGTVSVDGGLPTSATLSGAVHISRYIDSVVMSLSNLQITPPAGSPVIAVNLSLAIVGQSAAAMVFTNGPGTCGANGQVLNQTAIVSGVALQPA